MPPSVEIVSILLTLTTLAWFSLVRAVRRKIFYSFSRNAVIETSQNLKPMAFAVNVAICCAGCVAGTICLFVMVLHFYSIDLNSFVPDWLSAMAVLTIILAYLILFVGELAILVKKLTR